MIQSIRIPPVNSLKIVWYFMVPGLAFDLLGVAELGSQMTFENKNEDQARTFPNE